MERGDTRNAALFNGYYSIIHPNDETILHVPNNSCGYINDTVVCNYTRNRLPLSTLIPQVLQLLMFLFFGLMHEEQLCVILGKCKTIERRT